MAFVKKAPDVLYCSKKILSESFAIQRQNLFELETRR
jgi:hypothetical protein